MILALALIMIPFSAVNAAEDTSTSTVLGVELDSVSQPVPITIENDTPFTINLWATVTNTSNKKLVTDEATWTSSSSSIKVSKGVITATGEVSSATVTAKYQGFAASIQVTASYAYKELKLRYDSGADAPSTRDAELGNDIKLRAIAVKDNGSETDVTTDAAWSTSASGIATVKEGVVTLVSAGKVTITAKHKGRTDTIELNVTSPYESIKIGKPSSLGDPIELYVGADPVLLTATAQLKAGGTDPTITADATWTSSNSNVVKVEEGKATAVGAGTATITAKRFGVSDSVTFHVRTEYETMKLTPNKPIAFTLYGAGVQLQATVSKGTQPTEDITNDAEWKVADTFVAAIVKTTDTNGKTTSVKVVPKGIGSTKVTATFKGLTKEQTITVFPSIVSVDITKDQMDVFVEDTGAMPAVTGVTVADETKDISKLAQWTSSDESVISIGDDGKWKALKVGRAILTAKVENEPGYSSSVKTDTIIIDVHNKLLSVDSDVTVMSIVTGKEADLPAVTAIYENGEEENVTNKIVWKASSANLLVKAPKVKGLKASTVTLTGTYLSKSVTVKVTIEEEFTSFTITPDKLQLTLNKSQSIKVVGKTKSGKQVTVSTRLDWIASNPDVVQIKGASIKGMLEGSGKLTAVIQGKTLEVPYTVTAKMTKLSASVKSLKPVAIGGSDSVVLTADFENGKSLNVTDEATWTTSNARVATVKAGKITFVGKGTASIKGTYGGKTVTVSVSVK